MNFYIIFIQDNKPKEYNNVFATSNVRNLIKTLLYPTLGVSISLNYLSISPKQYTVYASFVAHYSVAYELTFNQIW